MIINRNDALAGTVLVLVLAASGPAFAQSASESPFVDKIVHVDVVKLSSSDQASNLIGSEIYTADDKRIGDVHDLILDGEHKVVAMTVGVGGFLGIDETNVALPMTHMTLGEDKDEIRLSTELSKVQIEQAAKE